MCARVQVIGVAILGASSEAGEDVAGPADGEVAKELVEAVRLHTERLGHIEYTRATGCLIALTTVDDGGHVGLALCEGGAARSPGQSGRERAHRVE